MGSQRSKEDEVQKMSISVFITNFPDSFSAKDLFKTCSQYGYVVDVYIPNKRSKFGKRFGFVRFIKVFNEERLVNNHCTTKAYSHAVKGGSHSVNEEVANTPAMVLEDDCLNMQDLTNSLMGRVKEFASLSNLKKVFDNEGFANIDIVYLGELWVLLKFESEDSKVEIEGIPLKLWSENIVKRITSRWGVLLQVDDQEDGCLCRKRVCIKTKVNMTIFESFKIIYRGKTFWIRAKEDLGWVPDILEDNEEEDESYGESNEGALKGDDEALKSCSNFGEDINVEKVSETKFEEGFKPNEDVEDQNNKNDDFEKMNGDCSHTFSKKGPSDSDDIAESICSGQFKRSEIPRTRGSIIHLMDELVKVGQVMGYNMDGCSKNIEEIIRSQGVNEGVWVRNGDVIVMGDFNEVRKKKERFGSMFNIQGANAFNMFISKAGLEEVPLGGTSFTWCHKSAKKMSKLDRFLISESLMSSCPNISAISLDKYLSDHRPILLREMQFDYGPIPFRFFHYWFEIEGFDKFVEDTWKEAHVQEVNAVVNLMKKLKFLKQKIRRWHKERKRNIHTS
ncbi:nucleotide-binding alpha-beta plait domain-containing protein [Tanacetum coccineum]